MQIDDYLLTLLMLEVFCTVSKYLVASIILEFQDTIPNYNMYCIMGILIKKHSMFFYIVND